MSTIALRAGPLKAWLRHNAARYKGVKQRRLAIQTYKKPLAILIAVYFIGSSVYFISGISWHNGLELFMTAVIFQAMRFMAGVLLILRFAFARYLALAVVAFAVVSTAIGLVSRPVAEHEIYLFASVLFDLAAMAAVAAFMFHLHGIGYYKASSNA